MKQRTIRVRFKRVGRGKATWEQEVPCLPGGHGNPDPEAMERAVRLKGCLASRDIGVSGTTAGMVFAGMHPVGTWKVV